MSFSYGYHFCSNSKLNCLKATMRPVEKSRKAALNDALRELKQTRQALDKEIKNAEKAIKSKG